MHFYRALLHLFPRSFRAEYGGEMLKDFARQWHEASGPGVARRARRSDHRNTIGVNVFRCVPVSVYVCPAMRYCVTVTLVCVIAISAFAQDHLATLGISEGRAKEAVFDSFMADAVSIAGKPAAFVAMAPQARVALVNFTLNLARTFVESDDFKRRYADHREANGPDPLPEEQTADQIFA